MYADAGPPGSPRAKRQRSAKAKRATAPKRARKDAYHHGDLRRALLAATLQLVEERGPQGFTLRAAAKAAGVTAGASYHHFEDKDALLAAVAEQGFDQFGAALEEAADQPAPTARERSRNVGTAYVLFAVKHPTLFRPGYRWPPGQGGDLPQERRRARGARPCRALQGVVFSTPPGRSVGRANRALCAETGSAI